MIIITEREIAEYTKGMFVDCGDEIICKHNPTNGEKDFLLCMIEQCVALLDREKINEALKNMGTYTGVTGNTKFEKSGDAEKNLIRFIVKDGKFVEWKK